MQEALNGLEFKPGRTFTFGFWCIAQFVDAIGWRVSLGSVAKDGRCQGLDEVSLPEVKLNEIGTHPPFYCKQNGRLRSVSGCFSLISLLSVY